MERPSALPRSLSRWRNGGKALLILFFALVGVQELVAQRAVRIRLFSEHSSVDRFKISSFEKGFSVLAYEKSGQLIDTVADLIEPRRSIEFQKKSGGIHFSDASGTYGPFLRYRIVPEAAAAVFQIEVKGEVRRYKGCIDVWVSGKKAELVNEVDLEDYVAGVVESEGGHVPSFQYFKAQAILARTFAMKNWHKHTSKGYNLKDDVSSQVYFHRAENRYGDSIVLAVKQTRDTVVTDQLCAPILAVFHANSGGHTAPAEFPWTSSLPYLKGRRDPYSLRGPSARWERRISTAKMNAYLANRLGTDADDLELRKILFNLTADHRVGYLRLGDRSLKLSELRRRFRLRSAYFTVEEEGSDYVLSGRGYGHGVGMSQDGAMVMASEGFDFRDIIRFYYRDISFDALDRLF
ncbi:MAG: Amidase enhancer [Flavobacteriia bacterium]|nr:MAG: Amidase enhancer [Flavobacteriia bacterium]